MRTAVVRRRLVTSLVVLAGSTPSLAQSRSAPVPLFHGAFVAGPAPIAGVSFTAGARLVAPHPAQGAHAVVAPPEPESTVRPMLPLDPSPAPARAATAHDAYGCALDPRGVQRVELALGADARAVQIALTTRGRDAVALVTVGRGDARQPHAGLVFPEARLVSLPDDGAPRVVHTMGFEPDASIAMGPSGQLFVASYTRLDVHAEAGAPGPSVRVATLDVRTGATRLGPRVLEGTAGQHIDSPLVPWRGGFAMVLGEQDRSVTVMEANGVHAASENAQSRPVLERLAWLGEDGAPRHAPWLVTDAQGDDAIGRYRVGLGAAGDDLAMCWTEASRDRAGVWSRRLLGESLGTATRNASRPAWGSQIARDGSGVLFRTGGEVGAPVRLFYAPWQSSGREPFALGAGWDPATAFVRGRVLVAGVTLAGNDGAPLQALVAASQPGAPPRAVDAPSDAIEGIERAVDFDLSATDDGVVVAWLEPASSDDEATRRLAVARVACR